MRYKAMLLWEFVKPVVKYGQKYFRNGAGHCNSSVIVSNIYWALFMKRCKGIDIPGGRKFRLSEDNIKYV